ncbi:MAG TPA: HEAT repeat domain-containing protein [Humisphaera sp.]|nr:HEAT repeat domain-containing protein [Humisphaera sp.]
MPRKTTTKTTDKRHTAVPKVEKAAAKAATPQVTPQAQPQTQPATPPTTPPAERVRPAEVEAMIAQLRHDDADISRDAATALGALGHVEAVEPLIQVMENCDGFFHPVVRAAAAGSLGMLKDARAVNVLITAVSDTHAEPSAEAIRALALIGDARALEPLMEVVRNANGYFLPIARRAAVLALASFRSEQVTALLTTISKDQSQDAAIRDAAAQVLSR